MSYGKVFRSAAELFTESALLWYRGISSSVDSWEDLKQELLDEFLPSDFDYRLMEELKTRTQGVGESFSTYYSVMLNFFARLRVPISEEEKLRILRRNIRPCFAERLAIVPIVSLSDFKTKCKEIERQNLNSQYFVEPPKPNQHTLATDLAYKASVQLAVAEVSTGPKQAPQSSGSKSSLFCHRCRITGHTLANCKAERFLICFRCGRKGYITLNCPDCAGTRPKKASPYQCKCSGSADSGDISQSTSKNL